jgi:flavin reductase (DIM6/NTAB) family NADH-FMN oxidoreductase RutF
MTASTPAGQTPSASDPAVYRKALSCFATGVTVVTTHWQDADWGMTCNSFSSVSLEPRLVLWSIRKASASLQAFLGSGGFSVSILAQPQANLARQFSAGDMSARFEGVTLHRQDSGRPRLAHALAWFDCSLHQSVDAGDHHILIGQVQDFGWQDTEGLGMWRSRLGRFEPLPA